jgi:hypothetical protein
MSSGKPKRDPTGRYPVLQQTSAFLDRLRRERERIERALKELERELRGAGRK